jgi:hypothetical protein
MGKTIIVSEETVRDLLEAHASLSAWYYELWAGLRAANATAHAPDDAARAAFVERLAADFPELAAVAKQIRVPRMYVPAPPAYATPSASPHNLPSLPGAFPPPPPPPGGSGALSLGSLPPLPLPLPPPFEALPPLPPPFEEPATLAEPSARPRDLAAPVAPPPMINPGAVKYER